MKDRIIHPPSPTRFSCNGPFQFGPEINRVCVHGWNCSHFLTSEEIDRTQHLINCGVITLPDNQAVCQVIEEVEDEKIGDRVIYRCSWPKGI